MAYQRSGALIMSSAVHLVMLVALVWVSRMPSADAPRLDARLSSSPPDERIVWIAMPGPRGGGGGGRPVEPPPPRPAPPKATRTTEAPVVTPVPEPVEAPEPPPEPVAPQPPAPAVMAETASPGAAITPATAPGGADDGPGSGAGTGSGTGPGTGGGFGGGAYRPGNGVTSPVPIRRGIPAYTVEAMRARAQGVITVECVVTPDGECGDVRVVQSFTPPFGLDQEAIAAARRWRFEPGRLDGAPVAVMVNLEIEFNIR